MPALPSSISALDYERLRATPALWLPVLRAIARSCVDGDVDAESALTPVAAGSNLIAFVGDAWVLKVFPPFLRHQFVSERATLSWLAQHALPTAIPSIVREGEHQTWPYLLITRVPGVAGELAWPALGDDDKARVLTQIGALIAAVQRVPVGPLAALEPQWPAFLAAQIAGCRARHERLGVPAHLLAHVDAFIAREAPSIPASPLAILTGEYIAENVLLDGARIAGLIDFGDVMIGAAHYDLLGPSTFLCAGDARMMRALLDGYGLPVSERDDAFARRMLALLLLHRHSNLPVQLRLEDWRTAASWDELAARIWPFAS